MNAKQKSQVLSQSNISQLREVDDVKGGKVERNFFQSTSVGEDRCPTLIRLPSNTPKCQAANTFNTSFPQQIHSRLPTAHEYLTTPFPFKIAPTMHSCLKMIPIKGSNLHEDFLQGPREPLTKES